MNQTLSKKYRNKIIKIIRETGCYLPDVWDVIGVPKEEYLRYGSEYENERKAAEYALYQVRWAWMLFGWKVCGIEEYEKLLKKSERSIPRVEHATPSRFEREYKGGFGSPIDWSFDI